MTSEMFHEFYSFFNFFPELNVTIAARRYQEMSSKKKVTMEYVFEEKLNFWLKKWQQRKPYLVITMWVITSRCM